METDWMRTQNSLRNSLAIFWTQTNIVWVKVLTFDIWGNI